MATSGKSWYMHTIDGQPAVFCAEPWKGPGHGCLCLIGRRSNMRVLVPDLATIRKHQRLSRESYQEDGIEPGQYDYIVFRR